MMIFLTYGQIYTKLVHNKLEDLKKWLWPHHAHYEKAFSAL